MSVPTTASGIVLTDDQRLAWLRLIRSDNVGPATFRALINQFGSAERAIEALPELARRGGARHPPCAASLDETEREIHALENLGARLVGLGEPDYPPWLRHSHMPPPMLAMRGEARAARMPAVAIVGARNASVAGRKMAAILSRDLGAAGFAVVSGFARGIDAAAHEAALDTGTVAVFAGGIDIVYPPENESLLARLLSAGGCVVSEMPVGTMPRGRDFPRRNRIIAGMAVATIVVEAAIRSGSLITARRALEENREVLAVPGSPLDPRAEGANSLIKQGARVVTEAADVLEAVMPLLGAEPATGAELASPAPPAEPPVEPADDERGRIVEALGPSPVDIDEIVRFTGLPARVVQIVLLELDLAGRLERHPGNRVSLI